jgi:hypothetical protein
MGAQAAIFSAFGYNNEIEKRMYKLWEGILKLLEDKVRLIEQRKDTSAYDRKIESFYDEIKKLILYSLKKGIKQNNNVTCYVFLAPPSNAKKALPGLYFLRKVQPWILRKIANLGALSPEDKMGFIDYFLYQMNEPVDFIKFIEKMIEFRKKDKKISFIEYYHRKYMSTKPKLFIYGKWDILLRPFNYFNRVKIQEFYKSCGNAEVHYGGYSHVLNDHPLQAGQQNIKNKAVTERIIKFLDRNI